MSETAELEPWQQRLLTSIQGRKPGELVMMSAGRNIGKSHFTNQAIKRLMDDLNANPITDIVLSEGTVYGSRYYTVEPIGGSWIDMETWCLDTFGDTGSIWQETKNLTPEPHKRWYANNRKFWFKQVKDRDWFILRWSK